MDRKRIIVLLGAAAAVAVVAGAFLVFGGDESGDGAAPGPEDVIKVFAAALAEGDAPTACEQLATSARDNLEQNGQTCEATLQPAFPHLSDEDKETLKGIDPEVEQRGDSATGTVPDIGGPGTSEIKLEKQDGAWKITDLGSAPAGGR